MEYIASVLAALAEPTRLGAMRLLWAGRELCVCELMRQLGATQSRMSRHMAVLKAARLVVDRRDAQWVRYCRNPHLAPAVRAIVDEVVAALPAQQTASAAGQAGSKKSQNQPRRTRSWTSKSSAPAAGIAQRPRI